MAMDWYKVTFSLTDMRVGRDFKLREGFIHEWAAAGLPKAAGLFRSAGVMETIYYFSPAATAIAMPLIATFRGVACAAPARSEVFDVCVNTGAKDIPFAE